MRETVQTKNLARDVDLDVQTINTNNAKETNI